jgi:dedicator of cytokinesis protein 3
MSSHDQLCETAVEILFSMIYAEYVLYGKFDSIETDIFTKLDTLVRARKLGNRYDPIESF